MPYIQRDSNGQIVGRFANRQPGYAEELLDDESPELLLTVSDARGARRSDINAAYESAMRAVKKDYPESEILTWDKQEREARAYQANNSVSTPFIDALANERGIEKAALVGRIMSKVADYEQTVGFLTGKRQRLEDQVLAAQTVAEVDAVVWEEMA